MLTPGVLAKNRLLDDAVTTDAESTSFDPYYSAIPFFYHATRRPSGLAAAGFFIDNAYLSRFDFSEHDTLRYQLTGGAYVEYVFAGPKLADILEAYTFLTGRMAVPPLWSLGHQQCRWHDYNDQQILAVGREYRTRGIPCDALWLDIGHMEGHRVFSFIPSASRSRSGWPKSVRRRLSLRHDRRPGCEARARLPLFEEAARGIFFVATEAAGCRGPGVARRAVFPDSCKKSRARGGAPVKPPRSAASPASGTI